MPQEMAFGATRAWEKKFTPSTLDVPKNMSNSIHITKINKTNFRGRPRCRPWLIKHGEE